MVFSEWPTSDHLNSTRSSPWGPMTGSTWSLALTQQTHDSQFHPELHDWSWGEEAPRIVTGGWPRPWKSSWWPTNSTTSSFRGILRGNVIDSLHPISDDLITRLLHQGSLGEVVHAELVPSCSHTPITSSLPHMPALSFPVLLDKWWPQWIPEPSPSSRAQNVPSLASNAAGENAMHVLGPPRYTEPSAFLRFFQGWNYKLCLELPQLGTSSVEASILSTWRPSVDASAETAGVRGWFPFRMTGLISLLYKGLSRIFSSTTVQKLNFFDIHSLFVQIIHLCMILGKNHIFDTTDFCRKVSLCFYYTVQVFHSHASFQGANVFWFCGCSQGP